MRLHLDTDFIVYALSGTGPERRKLLEIADAGADIQISAIAWYELARGPRTPQQLAVARSFFGEDGIVPFSEDFALHAAETFRKLGSPRKRTADIAIGVTAVLSGAKLCTRNARDFAGIEGLELIRA
jgi:predicted nucleic acid-binding protein